MATQIVNTTPLDSVIAVIQDYYSCYIAEIEADDKDDMASLYDEDMKEAQTALELYRTGQHAQLKQHIDGMDTSPREAVVVAFGKDLGPKWVSDTLGWDIR